MSNQQLKAANILRGIGRYGLLTVCTTVFIFSLVSGAETYGGGMEGIIKNSPNSLPWLLLLGALFIAWKREFIGGSIIVILGASLYLFFNCIGTNHFAATDLLTLIIVLLGICFITSWYLRKQPT
jgi:hypothetical protein